MGEKEGGLEEGEGGLEEGERERRDGEGLTGLTGTN